VNQERNPESPPTSLENQVAQALTAARGEPDWESLVDAFLHGDRKEAEYVLDVTRAVIALAAVREAIAERPELLEELGLEQVWWHREGNHRVVWPKSKVLQSPEPGAAPVFRVRPDA